MERSSGGGDFDGTDVVASDVDAVAQMVGGNGEVSDTAWIRDGDPVGTIDRGSTSDVGAVDVGDDTALVVMGFVFTISGSESN